MARLLTSGFELQKIGSTNLTGVEADLGFVNLQQSENLSPTISTSTVRSGLASLACGGNAANYANWVASFGPTASRPYFLRGYYNFTEATPTATQTILGFRANSVLVGSIARKTDGTLALFDKTPTQVGSASAATTTGTWYRCEMKIIVPAAGNGTLEFYLDGNLIATSAAAAVNNSLVTTQWFFGNISGGTAGQTVFVDDVAVNDDQAGSGQTGYPGSGKVVLLKPISTSANTGFSVGHTGDNLWDCVKNTAPTGTVVTDTTTANSKIKDATNNATDNYQPNLAAYTTAVASGGGGIVTTDTVSVVTALVRQGNSTTTSRNGGISGVSNPVIAETTAGTGTTLAATDPTGWQTIRSAPSYLPTLTRGTSPVIKFRKSTASTDSIMADFMGLYVEYVPGIGANQQPPRRQGNPAARLVPPTGGTF